MQFRFRGFISLLLGAAFLLVGVSGVLLYAGPSGRVAGWAGWKFLGLSKANWSDLHITVSFLLLIVSVIHWILNWSAFWSYVKSKASIFRLRLEMVAAVAVLAVVVAGTLLSVPPFSTTLALEDQIGDLWGERLGKPPISNTRHSEKFELDDLAEAIGLRGDVVVATLAKEGFTVDKADATMQQIADANGVTPAKVFAAIKKNHPEAAAKSRKHEEEEDGGEEGEDEAAEDD